jgi:hypothetical protein
LESSGAEDGSDPAAGTKDDLWSGREFLLGSPCNAQEGRVVRWMATKQEYTMTKGEK